MYVHLFLYFKEVERHNRFYLRLSWLIQTLIMKFNDVDDEGQGDMMQLSPVNLDDPDDVPRRESPLLTPIPVLVSESKAPMLSH